MYLIASLSSWLYTHTITPDLLLVFFSGCVPRPIVTLEYLTMPGTVTWPSAGVRLLGQEHALTSHVQV